MVQKGFKKCLLTLTCGMPTYNLANDKFHLHVEVVGGKEIVQSIDYMIENINLLLI